MKSNYQELKIEQIEMDVDNPRIKMYLEQYPKDEITAEGIALALSNNANDGTCTTFSSLKESIKISKGIIHPILVNKTKEGRFIAIEGNTRLQIYKDFKKVDPKGPWGKIRCIVYDQLSSEDIHSIRLQSHLVGPRDWDPFSKAKYLNYLSNIEKLPMPSIISMCGGKKQEIIKLIQAYEDMVNYYEPKLKEMGYDFEYRDFSKFAELQNSSIINAIRMSGYTKEDFATWVINKNINTAQNVRLLPQILKDKAAKDEFLKTNISEAIKKINIQSATNLDLGKASIKELGTSLSYKLKSITFQEQKEIFKETTDDGKQKKAILTNLIDDIKEVVYNDEEA